MFYDQEILEIWGQINRAEYDQDLPTRIETLHTEKQKPPNRIETQCTENQNSTHPCTIKQMLMQDKINLELIKKIKTEKKTILPSLRK